MEGKRRKRVTMKDIAEAAEVSIATVSHVINHSATISAETADRVRQTIDELGYKVLPQAEAQQGNRAITVFTPDISNEFYACIVRAISEEAWRENYTVTICNTEHHHKTEIINIRGLMKTGVQGLIFCGGGTNDEVQIIEAAKNLPVVLCDRKIPGAQIDSVGTNNVDIMKQMIGKLARFGYKRIGYVSEDTIMSNAYDRYIGFRLGMEENGLKMDKANIILDPMLRLDKIENGNRVMQAFLAQSKQLPEIFLCSSDLIAIGVIAALRQHGIKIPREVGVIGFDDISLARYTNPPLTTVTQDMKQLGKTSVRTLIRRIESPNQPAEDIAISAGIIVRASARL